MEFILLTKSGGLIGWIANILGYIMNGIFFVIDKIGLPNIGLAIILFTIVVNLLMLPLTIKQQKFSKLSAKITPETQAIQAKYKGRQDQESMMAQNQEIQAVYAKYGVSPSGSCVQLLIQMPILLSLYRVIQSIPSYVTKVGDTFRVLAEKIIQTDNGAFLQDSGIESITRTVSMYGKALTSGSNISNGIIDVLNKVSSLDMIEITAHYGLEGLTYGGQAILEDNGLIHTYNNFFGLNIGDSPQDLIRTAWAAGSYGLVIGALMIPVLSALTQWLNVKLMPQQKTDNKADNSNQGTMMQSMKMMNTIMPIFSAWLCFTLPAGMGLYWTAGSVVRGIQQVVINRHFDKMDFEDIIKKNSAKSAKKMEKLKKNQEIMAAYANMNTRNMQNKANVNSSMTEAEKEEAMKKATDYSYSRMDKAKPGSMAAKANKVREYNEGAGKEK
ncbi:MAG: YidC/Oxa1 family membrane protein insertase [Butyrivibrio sp.]|nr:YidC/Oxa1 family membrane protein insertase [Butyrivibrio sp.]